MKDIKTNIIKFIEDLELNSVEKAKNHDRKR